LDLPIHWAESSVSVPDGSYYIQITRRNTAGLDRFGPPEAGYSWMQTAPITISNAAATDLGIKYLDF
jgi:hypothetical protein